jgi:hypothetical protein
VHEEINHIRESTNMDVDPPAQQNAPELSFDASKDTRERQLALAVSRQGFEDASLGVAG